MGLIELTVKRKKTVQRVKTRLTRAMSYRRVTAQNRDEAFHHFISSCEQGQAVSMNRAWGDYLAAKECDRAAKRTVRQIQRELSFARSKASLAARRLQLKGGPQF